MQVGWLLDGNLFEDYHDDLVAAIRACGHLSVSLNRPNAPYTWEDTRNAYRKAFPQGACVVTHADIDLVLRVRNDARWRPGVFANLPSYFCSHYFAHLGRYLLNSDYAMLPFSELRRQKELLLDTFGKRGQIFVRPDSPLKIFTGQTMSDSTYDRDLEFMAFYDFPCESLVVVSSPKSIEFESRFVVVEGVVVAGSKNKVGEEICLSETDPDSWKLANEIAKTGFQPDAAWIVDICRTTDGGYFLLEIGAFSFANLYGCDKRAVVDAVSNAAMAIWKNNH